MRIIAISDTHGSHDRVHVPDGHVLVHAGDFTGWDSRESLLLLAEWLSRLPHRHKLVVAGNHDEVAEADPELVARTLTQAGATYLQDRAVTIDGVTFYGSPWTPVFMHWSFMLGRKDIAEKWELIPDDTDVLITHGPPAGYLDGVPGRGHQGCVDLAQRLCEVRPLYHIFGHIHEGGGKLLHSPTGLEDTALGNASVLDARYRLVNAPVVFDTHPR